MPRKKYFSYIRVSTQRQGQSGTSLAEQQGAIERFATSWGLDIVKRFEERETAAKQGRPVFLDMLKQLKQRKADGVIIHKIDRSARNLRDWADLGSMIDSGIEVHFAAESLDLNSRGGRLSADIQAVVASDYIRNLRDETLKGMYGRLNQGLFPFRAPVGYLDMGRGKPKMIDPETGPLVRAAFELYSTGSWGLHMLADEMYRRGLRSKATGTKVTINGLSKMLHNPFYIGLIRIEKTGEVFNGIHDPLISKSLYDQVQNILAGKNIKKTTSHFFIYRRLIKCSRCGRSLIGEIQKGRSYYRCQTPGCLRGSLRQDRLCKTMSKLLVQIQVLPEQRQKLEVYLEEMTAQSREEVVRQKSVLELQLNALTERQSRLLDLFMDQSIDHEQYLEKKAAIANELIETREKVSELNTREQRGNSESLTVLELATDLALAFENADPEARRTILQQVASHIATDGKRILITLSSVFQQLQHLRAADRSPDNVQNDSILDHPDNHFQIIVTLFPKVQKTSNQKIPLT